MLMLWWKEFVAGGWPDCGDERKQQSDESGAHANPYYSDCDFQRFFDTDRSVD